MNRSATLAVLAWLLAGPALAAAPDAALEAPLAYEIQPGDTLIGIGAKVLQRPADWRLVRDANAVRNARRLRIGSKLMIPYALVRAEPAQASLIAFRGEVAVTAGGAARAVARDMKLGEGDVLSTGPDAFLTLEFEDGSRTTLPSRSRLVLQRLRRLGMTGQLDRIMKLEAGRSEYTVQPLTQPKDRFVVTTPVAVAAVRGTRFRVGLDGERSLLEVVEGKVGSTTDADQAETAAAAGFGLVSGGGPPRLVPLLAAPRLQNPGRVQQDPAVAFELAAAPGASSYAAQLAADGGFVDLIAEVETAGPTLPFGALPDGDYFVRFAAVDGNGLRGLPSTYAFERRLNSFEGGAPAPAGGPGRRFRFRWTASGGGTQSFRFQLAATPEGTPIVDEPGLDLNEIVVTDLPPGTYYWRVLITRTQNGRQLQRWSAPEKFELGE